MALGQGVSVQRPYWRVMATQQKPVMFRAPCCGHLCLGPALWCFPGEGLCLLGLIRSSSFRTARSECWGWARTALLTCSLGTRPIWEWGRGRGGRTPECPLHHGVPTKPGESRSADRGLPCNDQLALCRLLRAAGETSKTRKTFSEGHSSKNES